MVKAGRGLSKPGIAIAGISPGPQGDIDIQMAAVPSSSSSYEVINKVGKHASNEGAGYGDEDAKRKLGA